MTTKTATRPKIDSDTFPCGECGERVTVRQLHTYLHCVLYKNHVNPADYGLVIVRKDDVLS